MRLNNEMNKLFAETNFTPKATEWRKKRKFYEYGQCDDRVEKW